ncbi:MAG TPA: hypothetical protein VJ775_01055 [Sphingomicrobium sp.]|nr:hypothetical protein [Sphingomicrobium sp.]
MRNIFLGLLLAASLSTPAIAGDSSKDKKAGHEKVVCKVDRSTGSHISDRICKTRSEWDEEKARAREVLDDRGRVGQQSAPAGGGGG